MSSTTVSKLLIWGLLLLAFSACQNTETTVEQSRPAEPPYQPTGNERFERVAPEESGVTFANIITENHQLNIITNSYMYNGGGVAVIDVNRDNLPDLYFVGTQEPNRLYLNRGDFQFEDITEQAGVAAGNGFKTGVTAVDINTDGWMDLYVCRTGLQDSPNRANLLYINNQDGTFSERAAEYGLDVRTPSNHANFFDYDLDGDLDMYLLNHPVDFKTVNQVNLAEVDGRRVRVAEPKTEFESDRLYRNNGNGTFTDVSQAAGIRNRAFGLSVTVSDINEDGYPDIYVGNDYIEPDFLYINQGNGTFRDENEQYLRHTSNHTMGVDIADFNNDRKADILSLDMIAEDNRRQKLLMTTMVLQRYNTLVEYGYGHQMMRNVLQLNTGQGDFAEIGTLAGVSNTDWSWSVLMADLDNDGWKDIYITNGYRRDVSNLDYLNYTVDSLNQTGGITPGRFPDFNDFLKLIPSERLQNYAFRNQGDLTFEKVSNDWGFLQPSFSNGAAYADLDADGDLDIVVNNIADPAFIYRNRTRETDGTAYLQLQLEGPPANPVGQGSHVEITVGEQTQVQDLNLVRGFYSSVQPLLHFGLDAKDRVDRLVVRWPDGKSQVLTDVEANQVLTLRYADADGRWQDLPEAGTPAYFTNATLPNFVHRENNFEDFNRERLLPHRLSRLGPFIAVADVDNNGEEDFFIGNAAGSPGALFLQQRGTFRQISGPWEQHANYEDLGCIFFDADSDGDADLYVVSGGNAPAANSELFQDRLYLNDGTGRFTYAMDALPRISSSGACVQAHDYDQDGDLDIFLGGRVVPGNYPLAPESLVLQNDGGRFVNATDQVAPELKQMGMITDLRFGDLDGDGTKEMVVAGEWLPITIFRFQNGKYVTTKANGLGNSNGWWNCLALADLDGDGDMDIAAGNLGLNSRIQASPQEPLRVYAADFDRNGSIDPIITYINDGVEYPLARREALIAQIAEVKKKFVYFEPYSTASVQEVFAPNELADAYQLEARNMASSVFINEGGTFKARALPRICQVAPVNQIVADDVNGDGLTDLLLVGNNYSADVESGPYDAGSGVLLLGRAEGGYRAITGPEAGFHARGDVRDLTLVNLANGNQLLLVSENNGKLQAWELRQKPMQ